MSITCEKDFTITIGGFVWTVTAYLGMADAPNCSGYLTPPQTPQVPTVMGTQLDFSITSTSSQGRDTFCNVPFPGCAFYLASALFESDVLGPFPEDRQVRLVGTATLRCGATTYRSGFPTCAPAAVNDPTALIFGYKVNGGHVASFEYYCSVGEAEKSFVIDETVLLLAGDTFQWDDFSGFLTYGTTTSSVDVRSFIIVPP